MWEGLTPVPDVASDLRAEIGNCDSRSQERRDRVMDALREHKEAVTVVEDEMRTLIGTLSKKFDDNEEKVAERTAAVRAAADQAAKHAACEGAWCGGSLVADVGAVVERIIDDVKEEFRTSIEMLESRTTLLGTDIRKEKDTRASKDGDMLVLHEVSRQLDNIVSKIEHDGIRIAMQKLDSDFANTIAANNVEVLDVLHRSREEVCRHPCPPI